jgi:hypothetical protein
MSKPVLVGYDPRKGDRAPVDFGVAMARLSGAPLVLAFVQAAAAAEGFSAGSKLYGVGQVDEDLVAVLGRLVQRASRARARQLPALEPDARRLLLRFDLRDRRRAYEAQIAEALRREDAAAEALVPAPV